MKRLETIYGFTPHFLSVFALCLLAVLALAGPGRTDSVRRELENLDPPFRESVLRGWRYFHTSFADDGVACVHCHRDHSDIVSWAGSYPKVQIFDQSPYEVKTIRTVITEAMARHTDLGPIESREMAQDIEAYIAWWGDGQPLTPGVSRENRSPEEDLAKLREAISRGRSLFNRERPMSCAYCHTVEASKDNYRRQLVDIYLGFPRAGSTGGRAVSVDTYLLGHYRRQGVVMSKKSITDIAAYLADLSRGKPQRPGYRPTGETTP
jgi:mono/diheme cytochrome c family protein